MREYSNKRRSHIHFIRQFYKENLQYTGIRVVIFINKKLKYIYDIDDFKKHKYENPKGKVNKQSSWHIVNCDINKVIKKQMINCSEDKTLQMKHLLYESVELDIKDYYEDVFKSEGINITENVSNIIKKGELCREN